MQNQSKKPAKPAAPSASRISGSTRKMPIKKTFCFIALAAIIAIAGVLTYNHDQKRKADEKAYQADKVRFADAEREMRSLNSEIVKAVGNPDQNKISRKCDHFAVKYSNGLYCQIDIDSVYTDDTSEQAKSRLNQTVISTRNKLSNFSDDDLPRLNNDIDTMQFGSFDVNLRSDFSCKFNISYKDANDEAFENKKGSTINLRCTKVVTKPIYPLAQ